MRKLMSIITACFLCSACASASLDESGRSARVFGKAQASVTCTVDPETKEEVCELKTNGEGLTENAVGLLAKVLEIPGSLVRGVGGAMP